ncbi:MAG: PAS domain-containing protein [Candidatus Zixiibacteriota bacterium]
MKTVIIGGGKGCQAIIDLAAGAYLKELSLDIQCVVDINSEAPGMIRARELGILTCPALSEALSIEGVELVIELTGNNEILDKIYRRLPPGVKIIDHTFAHIFWDLVNAQQEQERQLKEITDLEQKVEKERHRLLGFINSANDWISIKDMSGRYLIVNPVCATAFNKTPDDFIGRTPEEVISPEAAELVRLNDKEVLDCNCHRTFDEVFHLGGRDRHYQTVRFPLTGQNNELIGVCTIARDVTSERELNDQLVQAGKLAAVGQLAAGVAHEINNPLTGILAYAEDMLDDCEENEKHKTDLNVIISETIRCRDIVRNLLDFAKMGKLHLELVDSNLVVEQSLVLVHKLPQFRNIKIEKELAGELPMITCDIQQIQQVILNILLNAVDAMNGIGIIELKTMYQKETKQCVILVRDHGPGIDKSVSEKIFDPFVSTKGTNGLGLAVSWGIIKRHYGTIEASNATDGGAVFKILLPTSETEKT